MAQGQLVADDAVTLVRDNRKLLPLKASGTNQTGLPYMSAEETHNHVVVVIFSDEVRTESGRMFARQLKARVPDANILYVDPRIAAGLAEEVLAAVSQAQVVIAAVYVVPTAGKVASKEGGLKNSVALSDATGTLLEKLLERAGERTVVVAMGSPYLAADFPGIQNYLCTFSNATVSELSAVKALFGEIAITGHLPVSIPNVAQRGAGLKRPAQVAAGGGSEHAHSRTSGR